MNKEEYRYMVKCLGETIYNRSPNDSIQTQYYCRGIIDTLKDLLHRYSDWDYKKDLLGVFKDEKL